MELFVAIANIWKLLTSVASSLNTSLINYGFKRTEEDCSNVATLVLYVNGGRPLFVFIPNPKCNQDFNKIILETLNMPVSQYESTSQ